MCDKTITIPLCEFIPLYKIILYPLVFGYIVFCAIIGIIGFKEGYIYGYESIDMRKKDDNNEIMNVTFKCMYGLYYGIMIGIGSALLTPLIIYHARK